MDTKLTDQQDKIKDGQAPMPLYTCVHVKKDVSAKVFQGIKLISTKDSIRNNSKKGRSS